MPYLTTDRKKIIEMWLSICTTILTGYPFMPWPVRWAFPTTKHDVMLTILDNFELVRYSPELNEVIVIYPDDYDSKAEE